MLEERITALAAAIDQGDLFEAVALLRHSVPEYCPVGELADWSLSAGVLPAEAAPAAPAAIRGGDVKQPRLPAGREARA